MLVKVDDKPFEIDETLPIPNQFNIIYEKSNNHNVEIDIQLIYPNVNAKADFVRFIDNIGEWSSLKLKLQNITNYQITLSIIGKMYDVLSFVKAIGNDFEVSFVSNFIKNELKLISHIAKNVRSGRNNWFPPPANISGSGIKSLVIELISSHNLNLSTNDILQELANVNGDRLLDILGNAFREVYGLDWDKVKTLDSKKKEKMNWESLDNEFFNGINDEYRELVAE